jgi:acetyl esterase/lipase
MDSKELYAGAGKATISLSVADFPSTWTYIPLHDNLHVRVLILDNGEEVCLVSLELLDVTEHLAALQEIVTQETGIPADHTWIMVTHCATVAKLPEDTPRALRQAVRQAADNKVPAHLSMGEGAVLPNVQPAPPCSKTATLFQITDGNGQPIALLYHLGMTSSLLLHENRELVSADLAGAVSSRVEETQGGVALLLMGAWDSGKVKDDALSKDPFAALEHLGHLLGDKLLSLAEKQCHPVENPGIRMYHQGSSDRFPTHMSILRIGRTGILGLAPAVPVQLAQDLHKAAMFLGALTVPRVNGSAPVLSPGEQESFLSQVVPFFRRVQDGLHSMDPKVAAQYPLRLMDVAYGTDPSQRMDIWYPTLWNHAPCPVVLMLHGGAFQHGDKFEDTTEPMLRGLDRGYVVVSANYQLAPQATYPTPILDGKRILHYLRAHAAELGIDPNRIAVWGFSSGSWLVSMLALTAGEAEFSIGSPYSERVQAVIDWCGPCGNFVEMDPSIRISGIGRADHSDPHSPESTFMGAPINEIPEQCAAACPINHIKADAPPVLIVHGDADPVVPIDQSQRFYEALRQAGCEVELHTEPGKGHHGDYWYHETWLSDLCYEFLDRHLKNSPADQNDPAYTKDIP